MQKRPRKIIDLDPSCVLARAGGPRHFETRVAREIFNRVREGLAAELHQETDCRSVRPTAKAVIELLARAHGEGGRFFAVEGTAGDVVSARFLQGHESIDDLDDVDPGQQGLDEIVGNHGLEYRGPRTVTTAVAGPMDSL